MPAIRISREACWLSIRNLSGYSWITGEPHVGFVVFVRKRLVEIQYLSATITQEQRDKFGAMVRRAPFGRSRLPSFRRAAASGFPQNGCPAARIWLLFRLGKQDLVEPPVLLRRPGGDLVLLADQLDF